MSTLNPAWCVLIAAFLAPALTALTGAVRERRVPMVAMITTASAFVTVCWSLTRPTASIDLPWAETWGLRFHLQLDGLAQLYAMLATGIGLAVVIYASRYLPDHLHHQHRDPGEQTRFFGFLLLFMAAMVGLVMAQDVILLFVFWDLTAIASYFLIGFDRQEDEARASAMMALLVTGISAVFVMIGCVMLGQEIGTYDLPAMIATHGIQGTMPAALALIAVGALAKSAQMPLHFWLPRAMAAPTPVSAYLHSAAMVAAGVFLIGRFYPLMSQVDWLLQTFVAVGFTSMLLAGLIALTRNGLKQVLAYSTISQYGYVVFLFGMGGVYGVKGATFYVLAHAIVKSALFLTAGAITEATGSKNLSDLGGLARRLPLLTLGSGLAAAGLIALPLTLGFFKDELLFARASERGPIFMAMAITGAVLSFSYIVRFWTRAFLGPVRTEVNPISGVLVWPVVVLGGVAFVGGIVPGPFAHLASRAATVSLGHEADIHVAYHLDSRPENLMAIATWAIGTMLWLARNRIRPLTLGVAHLGEELGPARWYVSVIRGLNALSDRIHRMEVRDLRSRVASILLPAGLLVGFAVIVTPNAHAFRAGAIEQRDIPLVMMLIATVVSGFVVIIVRDHFRIAIGLSSVGYSLAASYAFMGAPNVTVVALVVETMMSLVMMGMLVLMPRAILRFETLVRPDRKIVPRDALIATGAGVMAFFVVWGALSRPASDTHLIDRFAELAPVAHARNVVTVILADFRGFDTMGEVTVIVIALIGILSLLRSGRLR